jgi:hypothetical protein
VRASDTAGGGGGGNGATRKVRLDFNENTAGLARRHLLPDPARNVLSGMRVFVCMNCLRSIVSVKYNGGRTKSSQNGGVQNYRALI